MNIRYATVGPNPSWIEREGFVSAYQQAFSGPPYFERYTREEVLAETWEPHLRDGMIVLATLDNVVVGFGCAMPLEKSPADVQDFMAQSIANGSYRADLKKAWYMSEVGVLEHYRGHGIGTALVKHRLLNIQHRGDTHYVLRTAAQGSNSIRIYERLGASTLPNLQDVSASDQVTTNGSQSTERVYLHGDCESALRQLLRA